MKLAAARSGLVPFLRCRRNSFLLSSRNSCRMRILTRSLHLAPPFLVDDYVSTLTRTNQIPGLLENRVKEALAELSECRLCPRNCGADRASDDAKSKKRSAACNTGRLAVVSAAFPHFGEESVLQGWNGSGTIFFGMCNLRCVFCQNWDISQPVNVNGHKLDKHGIADLMLKLQDETRCHNINLVTPEHVVPQVIEALVEALNQGLHLPVVYNTSSYDSRRSLELLDGLIDIYMPDFKFWSNETSQRLCKARDYPDVTREAIKRMHKQVGDLVFDSNGLAKRGLLVRHLVMPGLEEEGKRIMDFLANDVSKDTYVNVMEQYRPDFKVGGKPELRARGGQTNYSEIDRPVELDEVDRVKEYARQVGLWRFEENVWLEKPQSF